MTRSIDERQPAQRPPLPTHARAVAPRRFARARAVLGCALCVVLAGCGGADPAPSSRGLVPLATRLAGESGPFRIAGVAAGLRGRVTLSLNEGFDSVVVRQAGSFAFGRRLAAGQRYEVRVTGQPPGQSCEVLGGSGIADADVEGLQLRCHEGSPQSVHALGAAMGGAGNASALVEDAQGRLFALTQNGGAHGQGAVIRIAADGTTTVLHSFDGGAMDEEPQRLSVGPDGNLYGVATLDERHPHGVVFRLSPQGAYSVVHEFDDEADGSSPSSPLLLASDGRFYGLTGTGGRHGGGTLYRFVPHSGRVEVVHAFRDLQALQQRDPEQTCDSDGEADAHVHALYSPAGQLAEDPRTRTLYGTAIEGGMHGQGGVFGYALQARTLRTVVSIPDDFPSPSYGLVRTRAGELFGVLQRADEPLAMFRAHADGRLRLYRWRERDHVPRVPRGVLAEGSDGRLYGISELGGEHAAGALYSFDPDGGSALLHHSFGEPGDPSRIGAYPASSLLITRADAIHGITGAGGPHGDGVVFRIR